jgi:hypothetical protein
MSTEKKSALSALFPSDEIRTPIVLHTTLRGLRMLILGRDVWREDVKLFLSLAENEDEEKPVIVTETSIGFATEGIR